MELNRLQMLAGIPLTESKTLTEAEKSAKVTITFSPKGPGQLGDIIIFDNSDIIKKLAAMLNITEGYNEAIKVGDAYAQYADHMGLAFMSNEGDFDMNGDFED